MKSLRGSGTRVMSEDHALKRYDNGAVWDAVIDYIYANIPDEFEKEDVVEHLSEYYKTEFKRPITPLTAKNYAGRYIRYMRKEDTPYCIERCDDLRVPPVVLYKKVKPEKTLEEEAGREKPPVASAVMSSEHRLMKYGTTSVYKPILDFILEGAPDPFTAGDVSSLIEQYYRETLGRTLKESTQELYADRYIRYMRKSDPPIVERYADLSVSPLLLCRRIKYVEEPVEIEKEEGSDIADDIYDLAEKEGWTDRKKQVNLASIREYLPGYSIDEIFSGITYLIKKKMVLQMSPDEVRF